MKREGTVRSDNEEGSLRKMQSGRPNESSNATFTYRMVEDKVHFLESVDYVISAIEAQKKLSPKKIDTSLVKKALHQFLQSSKQGEPEEIAKAEFALIDEVENWRLNLAQRDKAISSEDLRLYCEHSRSPLSAHAILALARFYLSLPFSVSARTKFDTVITRLFTAQIGDGRRELTEPVEQIKGHLQRAYKNWANAPSFSTEDAPVIEEALVTIQKFISEAIKAEDLDNLLAKNLFREFYNFKNNLGERFFEPSVVAASIECNVTLGNRYDELLRRKAQSLGKEKAKNKYRKRYEEVMSEAVGMELNPIELLERKKPEKIEEIQVSEKFDDEIKRKLKSKKPPYTKQKSLKEEVEKKNPFHELKVSPLVITLLIVTIAFAIGLYFYVEFTDIPIKKADVQSFDVENPEFKDYLHIGRITGETFFGVVTNKWNIMTNGEREELVKKLLELGKQKGFKKVALINKNGVVVGGGSEQTIQVYDK